MHHGHQCYVLVHAWESYRSVVKWKDTIFTEQCAHSTHRLRSLGGACECVMLIQQREERAMRACNGTLTMGQPSKLLRNFAACA